MEDRSYTLPEDLILARQANLLRSFYRLVAALTSVALILIAFLPGFATSESVVEPFVRNVFVLLTIGTLYYLVQRDQVLAGIYGTILMCAVFASYSIYMESPGNMQMFTLIVFPTCVAGLLPTRPQFWLVYILNIALMLVTMWMVINYKGVEIEYRSIVTLAMLHTLIALLIDTMSSSYRDSIRMTFNQLVEIQAAEQRLLQLDADLDFAVSEKIRAEFESNQLEKTGRLALEFAGAGTITIDKIDGSVEASEDFMQRCNFSNAPTTLDDLINCIHPQDRSRFEQLIREAAQTRHRLEAEFRAISGGKSRCFGR
jgi:hypothetical protein